MRRKFELTLGILLFLVLLAGVPVAWKISFAMVLAVLLIISGLIHPYRHAERARSKDASFVDQEPPFDSESEGVNLHS